MIILETTFSTWNMRNALLSCKDNGSKILGFSFPSHFVKNIKSLAKSRTAYCHCPPSSTEPDGTLQIEYQPILTIFNILCEYCAHSLLFSEGMVLQGKVPYTPVFILIF